MAFDRINCGHLNTYVKERRIRFLCWHNSLAGKHTCGPRLRCETPSRRVWAKQTAITRNLHSGVFRGVKGNSLLIGSSLALWLPCLFGWLIACRSVWLSQTTGHDKLSAKCRKKRGIWNAVRRSSFNLNLWIKAKKKEIMAGSCSVLLIFLRDFVSSRTGSRFRGLWLFNSTGN